MKIAVEVEIEVEGVEGIRCNFSCRHLREYSIYCSLFGRQLRKHKDKMPFRCKGCIDAEVI